MIFNSTFLTFDRNRFQVALLYIIYNVRCLSAKTVFLKYPNLSDTDRCKKRNWRNFSELN